MPTDIDDLLGDDTVALRGPWNPTDLIEVGPTADDLVGKFEYHLDFPGDPLDAGCDYQRWARRLTEGSEPVVYAHVATEPAYPDKLALQYWFFYPFNDFNNKHEGDWEMIQLVFDTGDAAEALDREPVDVGYSAHEGAERSDWDDERLEVVDGTHPVVYPASGSHANKYGAALWLGSSAEAGVGCDDTTGPHVELTPQGRDDPERSRGRRGGLPVDRVRGPVGRVAEGVLQRPDRPEPEAAVDGADHVVGGLARPELRRAVGRDVRDGRDRLLLHGRRRRLEGAHPAPAQPRGRRPPRRLHPRADRLRRRPRDLAPHGAPPAREDAFVGSDPLGVGAHVPLEGCGSSSGSACS